MKLCRVYELVKEAGCSLEPSGSYGYDLYGSDGQYIDTLHGKQIEELQEDDFIEFYLND